MGADWRESAKGVRMTPELARIQALPRRKPEWKENPYAFTTTHPLCRGCLLCSSGQPRLFPAQAAALKEAAELRGLISMQGVGCGKTLVALLLPTVLDAKKTVILVDPALKPQMIERDIPYYSKHFDIRCSRIEIVAYSELSSASKADVLERLAPDLVVADECHRLKSINSARTKRFVRYMQEHPECAFVGLSGTLISRSILDYAHFFELALRKKSPLPNRYGDLHEWAAAIDDNPQSFPIAPGKLLSFCEEGEDLKSGFRRRIIETPGVITTPEQPLGTSLVLLARTPSDDAIDAALAKLSKLWVWDGEEIEDVIAFNRIARQLSLGFYYRWVWPNDKPDLEWLEARANWHRAVRKFLRNRSKPGMDSPLLLARAAESGVWKSSAWGPWSRVSIRRPPPVEAVWLSDRLIEDALEWCAKERGIVFYEHQAFGERLAERGSLPLFGGGEQASQDILKASPDKMPVIVCSQHAHGTGKNLQQYSNLLVTSPPSGAVAWEQIVGRVHRPGQLADTVYVSTYLHTEVFRKALEGAFNNARFLEGINGNRMKLLYADRVWV